MGGMRTAGDLVARMQMTRGMKIDKAKRYVADKLGVTVEDLTDPVLMRDVRRDLNLGIVQSERGDAQGIEAKYHIAKLLEIEINSLRLTTERSI
jgi:dimethylamine--corrinoid protein Co-methyltransferase